jgi:O-antigen ligase
VAQAGVSRPAVRRSALSYLPVKLDGLRLGLFLLIVIHVSRLHQAFGFLEKVRPALLLVAFCGLYVVLKPAKASAVGILKTTEGKLILALFIAACLSAPFGISLGNSATFLIGDYVKVVIGAFLLLAAIRHVQDLYALVWAYAFSAGILSFMAIFMFKMSRIDSAATRLSGLYTYDANDLGVVLMVGLPLTLLMFQHSKGYRKWMTAVIIAAIGVALARSGSRGALLGLLGTAAVLLIALKTIPAWKRAAFVGVVGLALVIAAPPGYWEQMRTIVGLEKDYNWTDKDGRRALIIRGLTYFQYYPVTGLGINNFPRAECMSDLSSKVQGYVRGTGIACSPPHNTYIQVASETGMIGFSIFAGIVFGGIWRLRKLRRKIPREWKRGDAEQRFLYDATLFLPVSMIGFAITCFFVSFAWLDIVYIVAVYMAGVTLSVRKRFHRDAIAQVQAASGPPPVRPSAPIPAPLPAT